MPIIKEQCQACPHNDPQMKEDKPQFILQNKDVLRVHRTSKCFHGFNNTIIFEMQTNVAIEKHKYSFKRIKFFHLLYTLTYVHRYTCTVTNTIREVAYCMAYSKLPETHIIFIALSKLFFTILLSSLL